MIIRHGGPASTDILTVFREAVALVCEIDPGSVSATTTFEQLRADSLVLVSVADVVEQTLHDRDGCELHIDDDALARMRSVSDVVDYANARIGR